MEKMRKEKAEAVAAAKKEGRTEEADKIQKNFEEKEITLKN
jgi:hypothetical protein